MKPLTIEELKALEVVQHFIDNTEDAKRLLIKKQTRNIFPFPQKQMHSEESLTT